MATIQPGFQSFAQSTPLYTISDGDVTSIARRYPYRKLDGRTKIRLLKLYPESHESIASRILGQKLHGTSLYGTLIEVDLAAQPSYECLSYTCKKHPYRLIPSVYLRAIQAVIEETLCVFSNLTCLI